MNRLERFCRALAALEKCEALPRPCDTAARTGLAVIFDRCFEQAWQLLRDVLLDEGFSPEKLGTPRAVIKLAWQAYLVSDEEAWLAMMDERRRLASRYFIEVGEEAAEKVVSVFLPALRALRDEAVRRRSEGCGR